MRKEANYMSRSVLRGWVAAENRGYSQLPFVCIKVWISGNAILRLPKKQVYVRYFKGYWKTSSKFEEKHAAALHKISSKTYGEVFKRTLE